MYCPQCGHQTDGGNFCEKCGSPLPGQSGHQHAAQTGAAAKQAAKQFGSFVLSVLKRPYQECKATGGEQLISAIITMVLFSLLTPLMFYILFSDGPGSVSFTAIFLEPTIYFISIWPACMHLFRPENRGKPSIFQGFILKIRSVSHTVYGYFDSCPFLLFITYRHLLYHISRWFNRCILRHSSCDAEQLPAFI